MADAARRIALPGLLITAVAVGGVAPANAGYRITHALVPGIGRVGTAMPSDTKVHPPAYIPRVGHFTEHEFQNQQRREAKISARVHPAPDLGPSRVVRRIKSQLARELFLEQAAVSCSPIPRAAFWVYVWIYLPPDRRAELDNLYENRQASMDDEPHCEPARLRIDRWHGVRVHGKRARAMVGGAYEYKEGRHWAPSRRVWKLSLRRKGNRWHITIEHVDVPGERPD